MAESVIPVDPLNPGQIFACLGLLELADRLHGSMVGWFDDRARLYMLRGNCEDPIGMTLRFIMNAQFEEMASFLPSENKKSGTDMAAPVVLRQGEVKVRLDHWEEERWSDHSGRESMKLYSGNRSAGKIILDMQQMITKLAGDDRNGVFTDPFNAGVAITGRFNFDPRAGWTALGMGFSPNEHKLKNSRFKNGVLTFPVVELFAAMGMQHARPMHVQDRVFCYQTWSDPLPPILARAAFGCGFTSIGWSRYVFDYTLSGKNKVLRFAQKGE